jgi:hypothetical protein
MHEIEKEKDVYAADPAKLEVLFKEMIQICLWSVYTGPLSRPRLTRSQGKRHGTPRPTHECRAHG